MNYLVVTLFMFSLVYICLYLYYILRLYDSKIMAKEFNIGMTKIIMNNLANYEIVINELELLYRQTELKFPQYTKKYKSLKGVLENTFRILYCKNDYYLKIYGLYKLKDKRFVIPSLIDMIEERHPFSNLNNNQEWLLLTIKSTLIENGNSVNYIFNQLANEIDSLNIALEKEEKQNKISLIISSAGIILTIFFGIIALK